MPCRRRLQETVASVSLTLIALLISLNGCTSSTEPGKPAVAHFEAVTPTELTGVVRTEVAPGPTVRATDLNGKPVVGVEVAFSTSGDDAVGQATVVTDAEGIARLSHWTLGTSAGRHAVRAECCGYAISFFATAKAGPVKSLSIIGGDEQAGLVGATLSLPLEAKALDAFGNPVSGAVVKFVVANGGGRVESDTAIADGDGVASSGKWTLGQDAGTQEVRAESGTGQVLFSASACEQNPCPRLEFLFVRQGNIYRFDGGEIQQLTSDGSNYQPSWSYDAKRVAFVHWTPRGVDIQSDLYVMDADGSNPRRMTTGNEISTPAWSPDGSTLAVALPNDGSPFCVYNCSIYEVEVADTAAGLKFIAPMGTDPDWSRDGGRIVFVSLSGDDGFHALYVVSSDGAAVTQLTARDAGGLFGPKWSPDGTRVAVSKCIRGTCDIYIVNSDGSGLRQLTSVGDAREPTWWPDGKRIAFTRGNWGTTQSIEYVAVTGGTPVQLLPDATTPVWRR